MKIIIRDYGFAVYWKLETNGATIEQGKAESVDAAWQEVERMTGKHACVTPLVPKVQEYHVEIV